MTTGRAPALVLVPSFVRAGYGAALLFQPGVLAAATGAPPTTPLTLVARLLGARHVAQSVAMLARPDERVLVIGTATDTAHATSDFLFARAGLAARAATADAVVACAFAALTGAAARRVARAQRAPV
jgi:hypothetical protein